MRKITDKIDGGAIRLLRQQNGITLTELGNALTTNKNNPHSYLSMIETGKRPFSRENEAVLIAAFKKAYFDKFKKELKLDKV